MKRKSKILIGLAIVFVALLVALFLARKQFVRWSRQPHRRRLPCGNRWWYQDSRLERKSRCC